MFGTFAYDWSENELEYWIMRFPVKMQGKLRQIIENESIRSGRDLMALSKETWHSYMKSHIWRRKLNKSLQMYTYSGIFIYLYISK